MTGGASCTATLPCIRSVWVAQQLRETFPYDSTSKHLIFDRAANFSDEIVDTIKSFGIEPKRTSFRSPWQNGVAVPRQNSIGL
jgi:hypothetical protein